jgi:plastocyanin
VVTLTTDNDGPGSGQSTDDQGTALPGGGDAYENAGTRPVPVDDTAGDQPAALARTNVQAGSKGTGNTTGATKERSGTTPAGAAGPGKSTAGATEEAGNKARTAGTDGSAATVEGTTAKAEMTFKASVSRSCPGEAVVFTVENMPTDGIYLWNFGDGSFSNKPNPEHTFTKPGNYQVMLSMSAAGVGTIHNKPSSGIITIHEAPQAEFNALKQEFEGHIPSVHFENRSNGGKQYLWDFGDGSTSTVAHPDHVYKKKGVYKVRLTVTSEQGCTDLLEKEVVIDRDYNLDAPATFAPAQAETFMPEALRTLGVKFHLMVYSADGQLVYETSDATKPWTGRLNNRGEMMARGEYVWVVDVRERLHLAETYTGKVLLR